MENGFDNTKFGKKLLKSYSKKENLSILDGL